MLSLLFECVGCRERPAEPGSFPLCAECLGSLAPAPKLCARCASPECPALSGDSDLCLRPWVMPGAIESFHSSYLLIEPGYRILKRWKISQGPLFNRRVLNPATMPIALWRDLGIDVVVPVPQRWERSWSLKGSPSEKIARWIHHQTGIPFRPALKAPHASRNAKRQAQLRATERFAHAIRFEVNRDFLPRPKSRILLVDDFMTTGHTLQAAAATLRSLGALSVHAFCLGVRPRRSLGSQSQGEAGLEIPLIQPCSAKTPLQLTRLVYETP